jgi:molybdenum cofactor synthesis domain-containing protein
MKTSILSIGTELTSGQILNRNAQWIAARMKDFGVLTTLQLVVPDERDQMLRGLEYCAEDTDVIFITGGLGPTTDDFTRQIVAEWSGKKLVWDEPSWQHIIQRLASRNVMAKDIQKQQAYFPEGAQILPNQQGTANGFHLQIQHQGQSKDLYVLPGPPLEVESVWNDTISPAMHLRLKNTDSMIVRTWSTMGHGESDIAERTEKALQGCPLEKGYRVHRPYVEVKLTYKKSEEASMQKWVDAVTHALRPMTVARDGSDIAALLCEKLMPYEQIVIQDSFSGAYLWSRLQEFARPLLVAKKLNFLSSLSNEPLTPNTLLLSLQVDPTGFATAEIKFQGQKKKDMFLSPQQHFAEKALIFWLKQL